MGAAALECRVITVLRMRSAAKHPQAVSKEMKRKTVPGREREEVGLIFFVTSSVFGALSTELALRYYR